ncbi:MAG: PcfJ domain-containing protein [Lachnospiraceae bacterium]|nr:PcfJ domain-containing protein [Lachnospiraceae bacterium]
MDKRKLSAVPRPAATPDMLDFAGHAGDIRHIVTASVDEDGAILMLNFFRVADLNQGKTTADFRTFLSKDDYISQDLTQEKTKWRTGSLQHMWKWDFSYCDYLWDRETFSSRRITRVAIRSDADQKIMEQFLQPYMEQDDKYSPWDGVDRFQKSVMDKRLGKKHKKILDGVDTVMEPVQEAPEEFFNWLWETGMSFSRYLIYKEIKKGIAECVCTYCKKIGDVDRSTIRLRNNEKGFCPFCGSPVTFKARGRMPGKIYDERWFLYVDPMESGFLLRYFYTYRKIKNDGLISISINKDLVEHKTQEEFRTFVTFRDGKPKCDGYEWDCYKGKGEPRWCPDTGRTWHEQCILYPGNLPQAWEHTPLKYSALEVLSSNIPTREVNYENAMGEYLRFPKLEWFFKMGLNSLAIDVINDSHYSTMVGKVNKKGETIYEILGLTKVSTKLMQEIDGNQYHLRLLQVAQMYGVQFNAETLKDYYEEFGCNTDLLKQASRKVTLHKLTRYISRESEKYPIGEQNRFRGYYGRYRERQDPRIERKRNMAKDWLEYLGWCKELRYDTNDMFIYMPNNFKNVHDRTAEEYKALQDKKAAAEKRLMEKLAKKRAEETRKAMAVLFKMNEGADAFSISGKGLVIVVPSGAADLKAEGAALHHCVGTYVDRVAKGETNIFFIRKAEDPDTPYFTLEYRDGRVIQCRGMRNCGMPPDVEAFVNVFEKKMNEAVNAELRRCS